MRSKASILPTKLRVRLLSSKESGHLEKNEIVRWRRGKSLEQMEVLGVLIPGDRCLCESKTKTWETQTRCSLSIALVDAQLHILVLAAKNDDHP